MKQEYTEKIQQDYPTLFGNYYHMVNRGTTYTLGIECGNGWFPLLYVMCYMLQQSIVLGEPPLEIVQIKEKFADLRVYTENSVSTYQQQIIDATEKAAQLLCEDCGSLDNLSLTKGYIRRLCPICKKNSFR